MILHHSFVLVRWSSGITLGNGVIVPAVSNDGRCERADELRAGLLSFLDRFRATRGMIACVDAILIYRRSSAQNAQRIEQAHRVALFGEANGHRRPVNPRTRDRDFCTHPLPAPNPVM